MDIEQLQADAEKASEREQSHTAKLLEHHLKLGQLERKLAYLQGELDAEAVRRAKARHDTIIFCIGVCYGIVLLYIMTS